MFTAAFFLLTLGLCLLSALRIMFIAMSLMAAMFWGPLPVLSRASGALHAHLCRTKLRPRTTSPIFGGQIHAAAGHRQQRPDYSAVLKDDVALPNGGDFSCPKGFARLRRRPWHRALRRKGRSAFPARYDRCVRSWFRSWQSWPASGGGAHRRSADLRTAKRHRIRQGGIVVQACRDRHRWS